MLSNNAIESAVKTLGLLLVTGKEISMIMPS